MQACSRTNGAYFVMRGSNGGREFEYHRIELSGGRQMKSSQSGFTLVELVVVIVILGILAATALPRFINVSTEARIAAVQGAAGGLRAAVAVVQGRYQAAGTFTSPVTMADGTTVAVSVGATGGFPTGATGGIDSAMNCESATTCAGMAITLGAVSTWQPSGGSATCQATYTAATGAVAITTTTC
jgi:MSHA pilin protein MshA